MLACATGQHARSDLLLQAWTLRPRWGWLWRPTGILSTHACSLTHLLHVCCQCCRTVHGVEILGALKVIKLRVLDNDAARTVTRWVSSASDAAPIGNDEDDSAVRDCSAAGTCYWTGTCDQPCLVIIECLHVFLKVVQRRSGLVPSLAWEVVSTT